MFRHTTKVGSLLGALLGLTLGCNGGGSDDEAGSCQPGTQYCECLGGTVCEGTLVCEGGYCVAGTDTDTTDTGMMVPGGPEIVDFGTNVSTLTQNENVIFTATVIDVDGPDDLQGGSLKSPDDSITYGAFNDNGDGTYSITVSWSEMHQAQKIEFDGSDERTFKAVFFDNEGLSASREVIITFTCAGGCAFDGTCPDTQNDNNHCGSCGNICQIYSTPSKDYGVCVEGACTPTFGECVAASDPLVSCAEVCVAQGYPGCGSCSDFDLAAFWYPALQYCEIDSPWDATSGNCGIEPDFLISDYYRCCCEAKN